MNNQNFLKTNLLILLGIALSLAGCAKKMAVSSSDKEVLGYRFTSNSPYQYQSSTNMSQAITVNGQDMVADIKSLLSWTAARKSTKGNNLELEIAVDSVYSSVKSLQGNISSNPDEIKGKSFTMKLSDKGEESGLEEAAQIVYRTFNNEETNLKASFSFIFPDLPDSDADIGYSWNDSDTIDMSVNDQSVLMIINSRNTITAVEEHNGHKCYRIEYKSNGERTASGNTPQGFISSSGEMNGSGYILFSVSEGVLVKDHTEQFFEGELTLPTGQSLPMTMDIVIETGLVK